MKYNPLNCIDFYKADHRRQYPEGTELVYSNFTPRSVKHLVQGLNLTDVHSGVYNVIDGKVVFFGLQFFIVDYLINAWNEGFFSRSKDKVVADYKRRMDMALGEGAIPVDHIEALHDLGYMPLSIRALPEGAVVSAKIPVFTIVNTKPEFFWLTNYLESVVSTYVWKPCNSATIARVYRQIMTHFAKATGADDAFVKFQGHDFSFRGMSGLQDAVTSGAGHLTSFVGTDTVPAIDFCEDYYLADAAKELIGCSVPATEHSVMCMGGVENEIKTFERLITEVYPKGIVSIVSDTWDFWSVVKPSAIDGGILAILKEKVMARDGKVVIRPDSGDPVKIIVGDPDAAVGSPEYKGAIECLWETFGGTFTKNVGGPGGYKVLDSHIGLIYGDSITIPRAVQILNGLKEKGFASTNVVLGIGSFTYEYCTRDTLGFAMKATAGVVNGETRLIFKDPKTDGGGLKKSARGFLSVTRRANGEYELTDNITDINDRRVTNTELVEVFRDGRLLVIHTLSQIRERLEESL